METKRQRQVAELVKRNFGMLLQGEGGYIYGSEVMVTVTNVKVTPDFSLAKIYLSVYNSDNKEGVITSLQEEYPRLKQGLAARIRKQVRRIPDIAFYLDETIDEMYRVEALFERLYRENQMPDKPGESEGQ
jgi:ribosome-binding factor A